MSNTQEMLKKIEYLREVADVGYEEALTLLERFDGDMTRVLVELERANKIRRPKFHHAPENPHYTHKAHDHARYEEKRRRHGENMNKVVNILFHKNIVVSKNEKTITNLPVAFYLVSLIFAPHLTFFALALLFVTGCRIHGESYAPRDARDTVNDFVANAAHNVRTTFDSVSSTIKNEFKVNDSRYGAEAKSEDKASDESGEYTTD